MYGERGEQGISQLWELIDPADMCGGKALCIISARFQLFRSVYVVITTV